MLSECGLLVLIREPRLAPPRYIAELRNAVAAAFDSELLHATAQGAGIEL